jgi:SAM-dependent methyltransferase
MPLVSQSRGTGQLSAPRQVQPAVLRWQWDAHAAEWIKWVRAPGHPDSYFRFHGECFLSMVPKPGRLTLDIGCGEGRVGRDLRGKGHTVLGIDCSFTMCDAAATHPDFRNHPEGARVIAGDATRLPLADSSADCAVAFMCLQDIDDMPGAFQEIARVLEDGKQLVLAIVHPMYSHGKVSSADNGNTGNINILRDYFEPELRISTDQQDDLTVTFYREHRPLEAYMNALLDTGFAIDQWHEVTETDKSKPNHRLPMFLDILATKKPHLATKEPQEIPQTSCHAAGRRLRRRPSSGRAGRHRSIGRRPAVSTSRRGMTIVPQSKAVLPGRWFGPVLLLGGTLGLLAILRS